MREAACNAAVSGGLALLLMKSERLSLEEIFLQVTESAGESETEQAEGGK